jgi:hypothetical protein
MTKWPINRMSHKTFPSTSRISKNKSIFPAHLGDTARQSKAIWILVPTGTRV